MIRRFFLIHQPEFSIEKNQGFFLEIYLDFALYRALTSSTNGNEVCVLSSSFATSSHTHIVDFIFQDVSSPRRCFCTNRSYTG